MTAHSLSSSVITISHQPSVSITQYQTSFKDSYWNFCCSPLCNILSIMQAYADDSRLDPSCHVVNRPRPDNHLLGTKMANHRYAFGSVILHACATYSDILTAAEWQHNSIGWTKNWIMLTIIGCSTLCREVLWDLLLCFLTSRHGLLPDDERRSVNSQTLLGHLATALS